jgi:dienelactone hydrolase
MMSRVKIISVFVFFFVAWVVSPHVGAQNDNLLPNKIAPGPVRSEVGKALANDERFASSERRDSGATSTITSVTFQSLDPVKPLTVPAVLRIPNHARRPMPAVVIVHGSGGVDSRGVSYARELNNAGIATLEIDMWAARGITGAENRPKTVPETLPDAYGAFVYLAANPAIDSKGIGIMGFSWGGVVSMLTATKPYTDRYLGSEMKFAAHAPNYPVCWVYNVVPGYEFKSFTGTPVFIQAGELDTYDLPDTCLKLVRSLASVAPDFLSLKIYPGATHAFDRSEPAITITDPFSYLGKGGDVLFAPNPEAAKEARAATTSFFKSKFGLSPE